MSKIIDINALEILDSRGNPTIKVFVKTEKGNIGKACVPSGASTGSLEAHELRDNNDIWFGGKGVSKAINNINNTIKNHLINIEVSNQKEIDEKMIALDGTKNKSKLGANAILGVSLAVLKAAAKDANLPLFEYVNKDNVFTLPVPMLNVINGGSHASNTLDFQEFMIMPIGAKSFRQALIMSNHIFHNLSKILKSQNYETQVGDEGGFAPNLKSHEEALDILIKAIKISGYNPATSGEKAVAIALDPATSEIFKDNHYHFLKLKQAIENKKLIFQNKEIKTKFSTNEFVEYWKKLVEEYPIISIEDGFAETDWNGFMEINKQIGKKVQIVGDDLTVTNKEILKEAINKKAINSILIKLNQIGTFSETLETIILAKKHNLTCVISHRSGETEDTTIADLAVGLNTGQIKTGSLSRSDRIAKYNRLLEIEAQLGKKAIFNGKKAFYNLSDDE